MTVTEEGVCPAGPRDGAGPLVLRGKEPAGSPGSDRAEPGCPGPALGAWAEQSGHLARESQREGQVQVRPRDWWAGGGAGGQSPQGQHGPADKPHR